MSERVLATEVAVGAARRMQTVLSGDMRGQVRQLLDAGQRLCNPAVWDGPTAATFRSTWPRTRSKLQSTLRTVAALDGHATKVLDAIEAAGTDLPLRGGAHQNGGAWNTALNVVNNAVSIVDGTNVVFQPIVTHMLNDAKEAERAAEEAEKFGEKIPGLMQQEFSDRTRPLMQAMTRDDATIDDLIREVRAFGRTMNDWDAIAKWNQAFRAANVVEAGRLGLLGRLDDGLGGLSLLGDVLTEWHPNAHGTMAGVDRGVAGADALLNLADMTGLGEAAGIFGAEATIPFLGEVAMFGTGTYLLGSYLYQHWTPFRHVAQDVGHGVARAAKDVWHAISNIF